MAKTAIPRETARLLACVEARGAQVGRPTTGTRHSSQERAGYERALQWIFAQPRSVAIAPEVIRKLHALALGGGEWKTGDNKIEAILANGERREMFVATPASAVPAAVDRLCRGYHQACEEQRVAPLLIVATFVFDLLAIHPFRGGNGRVARLAAVLLLRAHGFTVTGLEDAVDRSRTEYYRAIGECARGWHEGTNEIVPWWNYFMGVVHEALCRSSPRIRLSRSR